MKLLVLTNNPDRPSFRQRIEVYLDTLKSHGINCEIIKLTRGRLSRFRLFKRSAEFDAVYLHKKCLNFIDTFLLRRYSKKIIYDFDDAVMYSPHQPESNGTSHFRLFRRTIKMADMAIAGNSYLAEHAKRFNDNVHILPTGLDTKAYRIPTEPKQDDKIRLVWIGSKSTLKYIEAIKPALEEIGKKLPNVILRIICDEFFDLENMEVEKRRWSIETQLTDLVTSDIGLAPLPSNRFTKGKCGFKVLQYAAAGLPVVASPVGVNAELIENKLTGFHAKELDEWSEGIETLAQNPELRKQMGEKGREIAKNYDMAVIGKKLTDLILSRT